MPAEHSPVRAQLAKLHALAPSGGPVLDDSSSDDVPVYIWPECLPAWDHWNNLQTQWRPEASGLDYAGVASYFDEQGMRHGKERRSLFSCIRACERAAIDAWAERRAKKKPSGK